MYVEEAYKAKEQIQLGRFQTVEDWARTKYCENKAVRVAKHITDNYGDKVQYLLWHEKDNQPNNPININPTGQGISLTINFQGLQPAIVATEAIEPNTI